MRHKNFRVECIKFFAAICLLAGGVSSVAAQTYEVVVYTPPANFVDTTGEGLGGAQRVGTGRLFGATNPESTHALLWTNNSLAPIDLHPSDPYWTYSVANDTDGNRQVGHVRHASYPDAFGGPQCAALWSGSAASFTQLCGYVSPGFVFTFSDVFAIGGDQQVGYVLNSDVPPSGLPVREDAPFAFGNSQRKAALWRGSSASYVSLHPGSPWSDSFAYDTDGVQQVGEGTNQSLTPLDNRFRALLWSGTRQSFVDLTPPGYIYTQARGVKNGVQVGSGSPGANQPSSALLWRNTAASARVLRQNARAHDTNGATHVGAISASEFSNDSHAFRWDGDTGAGADLHLLLPAGVYRHSSANKIDQAGNIIGTAQRADNYRTVAVLWRRTDASNSAPALRLTSPSRYGSYYLNNPFNFTAEATDQDGTVVAVEFYVNGQMVGASGAPGKEGLHEMSWMPNRVGLHRIQARATDNNGATTVTRPIIIRVGRE